MKINFLWIGDSLSKIGQLSLKSFADNGHEPVLWVYNKNCANIPPGVTIEDAGQIIHPSKIFSYKGNGDCRLNSYGGFSDIFRYYLINTVGGWYCDMDVTCLKNFETISSNEYILRPHNTTTVVGNIIKAPSSCAFLDACIYDTELEINENNNRWVKPLEILNKNVQKFNLTRFIVDKCVFGNDDIFELRKYLAIGFYESEFNLPEYAIHWCNEAVTTGQWDRQVKRDWEKPLPTTLYYKLLKKHKLL